MKILIYRPIEILNSSLVKKMMAFSHSDIETVHTFNELLSKIKTGNYDAIYATRPESFSKNRIQYHELINVAIENKTKVFETYSATELTAPYKKEQNSPFSNIEFASIKRFIDQKNIK